MLDCPHETVSMRDLVSLTVRSTSEVGVAYAAPSSFGASSGVDLSYDFITGLDKAVR